jgi:ubiquinone/menaquinone biosynthesis C-methylase UbiE
MEWYARWFGEEYLLVYDHRDTEEAEREVRTIEKILAVEGNERILDLCCGSGRHDIPLARLGCRVTGLDYSGPLLKIARSERPPGERFPLFVRADVRKLPFRDEVFDIALNLFTSFGYFEDEENYEFLRSMSRVLKTGGRFYIDYLNPPRVLDTLVEESTKEKNSMLIIEKRKYNSTTSRIEKTIIFHDEGHAREFNESVRLYEKAEFLEMLSNAGLSVDGVMGSFDGEPYGDSSERMILYGKK